MDGKVNTLKMVPIIADDDFIKVFNLEMIKGESLEADYDNYWGGGALQRTVVINESAWKAMKVEILSERNSALRILGGGILIIG